MVNVVLGCTLNLYDHQFSINIMPMELGSFDVIVEMDCLARNKAGVEMKSRYRTMSY
jgi:hypothetical protein